MTVHHGAPDSWKMETTRESRMARLCRQVACCPRCPELVASRTVPVFGEGVLGAKAFLVGEAPGRQEDLQGQPFVGPAGELLDELLAEAGLSRGNLYVTNIIKCHPANNRTPKSVEIANCRPYLLEQIELVRPQVVCTLGRVAACALLQTHRRLEVLRERTHEYEGIPLVCTFHPAFVRRTPAMRAAAIEDLRLVHQLAFGVAQVEQG